MDYIDIIRYLNGQAGREETARIEAWIEESKENKMTFHRWKAVWESAGAIVPPEAPNVDQAWAKVQPQLQSRKPVVPLYRRLSRIAAVIAFLICLSYFGWPYLAPTVEMQEVTTLTGAPQQVELPDGSKVWLGDDTKLAYPKRFKKKTRRVKLSGTAFFDITRDEAAPFLIEGNNSVVQVLGTSFVVRSHPDSAQTKVQVKTGKVALFQKEHSPEDGLVLTAGEQGTFNSKTGTLQKDTIPDPNYLAWQNRVIKFDNTLIGEVERTLEEVYQVDLIIENPKLYDCLMTGTYEDVSIEEILEFFTFLFNTKVEKEGKKFRIVGGTGC